MEMSVHGRADLAGEFLDLSKGIAERSVTSLAHLRQLTVEVELGARCGLRDLVDHLHLGCLAGALHLDLCV